MQPAGLPPRNQFIMPTPTGTLTVRNPTTEPVNKHLSAVADSDQRDNKRYSTASEASTTASDAPPSRRKRTIGPWHLGKTLGKGALGRVRLVRHVVTGQLAAVKVIPKQTAEIFRVQSLANLMTPAEQDLAKSGKGHYVPFGLEREIAILTLLKHPNIISLYDIWENRNEL